MLDFRTSQNTLMPNLIFCCLFLELDIVCLQGSVSSSTSCLPDFVELEPCANQTARELGHLPLLLCLTISEFILYSSQILIR